MDIRGQRTWCDDCTAPRVWPDNVRIVELFLQALPAWRGGQGMFGAVALEGFDRSEVAALMDMHGMDDKPTAWAALYDMESEYRQIRAAQRAAHADRPRHGK